MAVQSLFRGLPDSNISASPVYEILPAFDVDLQYLTREIMVNAAGNLQVTRPDGVQVTIPLLAGKSIAIAAKQVNASGTSIAIGQIFLQY